MGWVDNLLLSVKLQLVSFQTPDDSFIQKIFLNHAYHSIKYLIRFVRLIPSQIVTFTYKAVL